MKKTSIIIIALLVVIAVGLLFFQGEKEVGISLWKNADYTKDTILDNGDNCFFLTVTAGDKSVNFTVKTDKNNVGEALKEVKLIEGEEGPYGIYVKKVNGILADYDVDQSYWSFEQNGEAMLTGVDSTEFKDGETFEFVYTK